MSKPLTFARYCALLPATLVLGLAFCVLPANAQDKLANAQDKPVDPDNPRIQASLTDMSVFPALNLLIRSTGKEYRFAPQALRNRINAEQKVDLEIKGTLQQGLLELLKQVEPPLTFRVENSPYAARHFAGYFQ